MGKHHHKVHEYPRMSTRERQLNDMCDKLEELASRMFSRLEVAETLLDLTGAVLETQIEDNARLEALAEQWRLDKVAMRGHK